MSYLPLSNILHHKLRSVLSALGIGVGICMLITLSGLSRGSLGEIGDRWESVDAELIAYPKGLGTKITTISGGLLSDKAAERFLEHKDLVQSVVPILLCGASIGGQDNLISGIDPWDWKTLTNDLKVVDGVVPDHEGKFTRWYEKTVLTPSTQPDAPPLDLDDKVIAEHGGMELMVDERLAKKGRFHVGDTVNMENHAWKIVGICPSGVITRVFMPRRTAQKFFSGGSIHNSTLMFVKLRPGVDQNDACRKLACEYADLMPKQQYRASLDHTFGIMFTYIDIVNAIALVIAFLFIMITLYMMVLQRTRDIAILKSCGASNWFILRQMLAESMLLTFTGTAVGIALSFPAAWLIQVFAPLLTVQLSFKWIAVAILAAAAGALVSGLYPGWRATRVDMVEALTNE
jgi:putative ABC transport system permease protein